MGYMRFVAIISIALIAVPLAAAARPVSFAGSWMLMQMNGPADHSLMALYSPTAQYAVGVRTDYTRKDETWMHSLTYNRLLQRWNAPESQGNLFLQSGAGAAEGHGETSPALWGGIEADWETRRVYFAYENRLVHAGDVEKVFTHKARAGVAPYIGGYNDLHTWLMVQVDHRPEDRDNVVITPFVRLFTTEVLTEFGVSNKKDAMINVTLQF